MLGVLCRGVFKQALEQVLRAKHCAVHGCRHSTDKRAPLAHLFRCRIAHRPGRQSVLPQSFPEAASDVAQLLGPSLRQQTPDTVFAHSYRRVFLCQRGGCGDSCRSLISRVSTRSRQNPTFAAG